MKIKLFFFCFFTILFASCANISFHSNHGRHDLSEAKESSAASRINSSQKLNSPYVLLISIDGFRADYLEKFSPPNILQFFERGARAQALIPAFPSKTFPNHYSIITGLYPENHGIVSNTFYDLKRPATDNVYKLSLKKAVTDGSWYQGVPLWSLAEMQGMLSGIYFWPGSEAKIAGFLPSYYIPYDGKKANDERVETVLSWLKKDEAYRPHFLTLYFSDVDSAGHFSGTESSEVKDAVLNVDRSLGKLFEGVKTLPFAVNVILVSDHGMQDLDDAKVYYLDEMCDLSTFLIGDMGPLVSLYQTDGNKQIILETYKKIKAKETMKGHFKVYLREEMPAHFHFDKNPRGGDIVVVADAPYSLGVHDDRFKMIKGSHGYDPHKFKNMHGIFLAKGPNIKSRQLAPFENIHIYPFIARILGLDLSGPVDGKFSVLQKIYHK